MAQQPKKGNVQAPDPKQEWINRDFGGINTQPYRTSIEDDQFSWLENAMPIGKGNIKVVPACSASQQTFAGKTAIYAMSFNAGGTDYHFVVCSDGAAFQILQQSPFTRTVIGAAGTFTGTAGSIWAAQWKNAGIVIVDSGKGYFDWNVTAGNTLTTIDATKKNSLVAVYSGRVWMANSRTVTFTDAASYNSFAGSGGSFVISDPALHDIIYGLLPSNNFLYIVGSASVFVISDVRVVGGVAVFSNTIVQTSIGSIYPLSLYSYYRAILFATNFGVYSLYGATPTKVSDELDGIFPLIDFTKPVSGGAVIIYNQLCAAFCFTYNDVVQGPRQLLAINFNKKWFLSSQGTINFVWSDVMAGTPVLFGTDGSNLFQLWSNTSASINSVTQTKLYDFGSSLMDTNATRFGIEAVIPAQIANLSVTIDTESNSSSIYTLSSSNILVFVGVGPIQFVGGGNITFLGTGFARYQSDVSNWGHYLGATITSSAAQLQLTAMMMEYIKHQDAMWGT